MSNTAKSNGKGDHMDPLDRLVDEQAQETADQVPAPRQEGVPGAAPLGAGIRGTLDGRRYDLAHMESTEPPPIPWMVENFAARGEVTQLWARPGFGKSFVAMSFAGGVGHGEEVAGFDCEQGRASVFDAESGRREVHRRVRNLGLPADAVSIYEAAGLHLVRDLGEFRAELTANPADLIVFDSLRRLLPGTEENDSDKMAEGIAAIRQLAQEFDAAAVVIHHGNKAGTSYRGSTAIEAEVSLSFKLDREAGDPDKRRRVLRCEKARICEEPDSRWLRLSVEFHNVYVEAAGPYDGNSEAPAPAAAAIGPAILALLDNRDLTRPQIAQELGRTPKDGTVRRVLSNLEEAGHVEALESHRWRGCHGPDALREAQDGTPHQTSSVEPNTGGASGGAKGAGSMDSFLRTDKPKRDNASRQSGTAPTPSTATPLITPNQKRRARSGATRRPQPHRLKATTRSDT